MALSTEQIAGIAVGSVLGVVVLFLLITLLIRCYHRNYTKGSDNPKKLEGKVVVITGK